MQALSIRLFWSSTFLTLSTLVAGGLGYVFQVLMGRLLSNADFAVFSSLNALTMILGSPLAAIMMLITRRVAEFEATANSAALPGLYRFWQIRVLMGFLALACILTVWMPHVQAFVKTGDASAVWLFWGVIAVDGLAIVNAAFLQGLQRFAWLAGLSVVIVVLKIGISCALIVSVEWGLRGALSGMLLAGIIIFFTGLMQLRLIWWQEQKLPVAETCGFPAREIFSGLSATVGFAVLSQADVPLANRLLPPDLAASYAAAAVLGKAVLYLPGGVALALFPMVASQRTASSLQTWLLYQSLFTTTLACAITASAYGLFAADIIVMAYGSRHPAAPAFLQYYGWAMLPLALVFLLNHFFVASADRRFSWFVCLAGFSLVVVTTCFQPSPYVLLATLAFLGTLLCVWGCWAVRTSRRSDRLRPLH